MPVYVDNMRAKFGRMIMCHMIADTHDELTAMAAKLGLQARWIQNAGTYREHYDISLEKKKLALSYGAIEIDMRELAQKIQARKPE